MSWVFYSSVWTSVTKYYRLGGFKKRNLYFHSSWRLEVPRQGAGRVGFCQGLFFFFLPCKGPPPYGVLTWLVHHVNEPLVTRFLEEYQSYWIRAPPLGPI